MQWFKNKLTSRKQTVTFKSVNSDVSNIRCGVPQGLVLGPYVFFIYANDISKSSNHFADDKRLFYGHKIFKYIIKSDCQANMEL